MEPIMQKTERYFIQRQHDRMDDLGFLDVAKSPRLFLFRDLLTRPLVWIVGRPWIGKTTFARSVDQHLRSNELDTGNRYVDLTSLGQNEVISPSWWNSWLRSNPVQAIWIIDGIDECLPEHQSRLEKVAKEIEEVSMAHLSQLKLIFLSRPYAELTSFRDRIEGKLKSIHGVLGDYRFTMARMDRDGARVLIGNDRFELVLEIIRRNQLQQLAGFPIVLKYLAKYANEIQNITVPEVWRGVLETLIGQPTLGQPRKYETEPHERFDAACRVAAILTMTGEHRIREYSPRNDEPTFNTISLDNKNRLCMATREVCRTALFIPSGDPNGFQFVQRNAQDWLTAFEFTKLPGRTLRSICIYAGRMLDPRFQEIVNLLQIVSQERYAELGIDDADNFPLLPSDCLEPTLPEIIGILDRLETLADTSPWGLRCDQEAKSNLSRLDVEGIGHVLSSRLLDPDRSHNVKDLLIDVAEAIRCLDVIDPLLTIILDEHQDAELRYASIVFIVRFGENTHLDALMGPIAQSNSQAETESRLCGVLLAEVMKREIWPIWKVLLHAPVADRELLDSRQLILYQAENTMTHSDACALIPHLTQLCQKHHTKDDYHRLPPFVVKAINLIVAGGDVNQTACGHLVDFIHFISEKENLAVSAFEIASKFRNLTPVRRKLVELSLQTDKASNALCAELLLIHQDCEWFFQEVHAKSPDDREAWALLYRLSKEAFEQSTISNSDFAHIRARMEEKVPGLIGQLVDASIYHKNRDREREESQRNKSPDGKRLSDVSRKILSNPDLSEVAKMHRLAWNCFVVSGVLYSEPGETWFELPQQLRKEILEVCKRGIEQGTPSPVSMPRVIPNTSIAEASAFIQIIKSDLFSEWLQGELIKKWVPNVLISQMWSDWADIINFCNQVDPAETRNALLEVIDFYLRNDEAVTFLNQIPEQCWTLEMTERVLTRVHDSSIRNTSKTDLIVHLCRKSPDKVSTIIESWANFAWKADIEDVLRLTGTNLLLAVNTTSGLDLIERNYQKRNNAALEELSILWDREKWVQLHLDKWPSCQIERLLQLLLFAYPLPVDSDFKSGFVTPDQELRTLRNRLVSMLLDRDIHDARDCNDRLARQHERFNSLLLSHRSNRAAKKIIEDLGQGASRQSHTLSLKQAMSLLEKGDYRLIRDEDDLLEAVHQALVKIEQSMGNDLALLYSLPIKGTTRKHLQEDALQSYLRLRLNYELTKMIDQPRVQLVREDEINRRQRLDIRVLAACYDSARVAQVIVEVKWSDNLDLLTALEDQLGTRYLIGERLSHGILVVGWVGSWRPRDGTGENNDVDQLRVFLQNQRNAFCAVGRPGEHLTLDSIILDARWSSTNSCV